MLRLTLKNIWAYKTRLLLSMTSIVLGVSFLMGTFVISATLNKTFDDLFASVFKSTDAVVRSGDVIKGTFGETDERAGLDKSILQQVKAVDGVKSAEGEIQVFNPIILDDKGDRLFNSAGGAPVLGFKWGTDDILKVWRLVGEDDKSLTAEQTANIEIADNTVFVDKATFDSKNFKIGTKLSIIFPDGPKEFSVAGAVRFGEADGAAGAPSFLFNEEQITELAQRGNTYDAISVVAEDGLSQKEVVEKIKIAFADSDLNIKVITGDAAAKENQDTIKEALSFFNIALSAFAAIAFVVAIVIIINSFAIILAQRQREYALLRAVGAKASQIRRSVILESLVVGLVASATGVATGIGLAVLIKSALAAFGLDLPDGPLEVQTSSIVVCLVLGTLATVLSAFIPAFISSRIPPIAALSEAAFEKKKKWWPRATLATISGIIFVTIITLALTDSTGSKIRDTSIGLGAGFMFLIFVIPFLVKPFTLLIGSRVAGVFLLPFGGRHAFSVTGMIAKRNNSRNPRRTSRTALALVIGVALVSFVTVFAASVNKTVDVTLKKNFVGDFIVSSDGIEPIVTPQLCEQIVAQDFVQASTCLKSRSASFAITEQDRSDLNNANGAYISGFNSKTITEFYATPFRGDLNNLGADGVAVTKQFAESKDLELGSKILIRLDAGQRDFTVKAIVDGGIPIDFIEMMIDNSAYDELSTIKTATSAIVLLEDGINTNVARTDLEELTRGTGASVNDQKALRDQNAAQINQLLSLIYALLGLAIVIASIGIVNTMSLSILERTRELGLLRAVGMSKRQVRNSIRFESVITAVMGTAIGIVFGVSGAYFLIQALKQDGLDQFATGGTSLIAIVALSAFIGVLAGAWPAWRATKIDILKAVSTE